MPRSRCCCCFNSKCGYITTGWVCCFLTLVFLLALVSPKEFADLVLLVGFLFAFGVPSFFWATSLYYPDDPE